MDVVEAAAKGHSSGHSTRLDEKASDLHLGGGAVVCHLDNDGELAGDGAVNDRESINLGDPCRSGVQRCFQSRRQLRKGGVCTRGDDKLVVRGIDVHISRVVRWVDV